MLRSYPMKLVSINRGPMRVGFTLLQILFHEVVVAVAATLEGVAVAAPFLVVVTSIVTLGNQLVVVVPPALQIQMMVHFANYVSTMVIPSMIAGTDSTRNLWLHVMVVPGNLNKEFKKSASSGVPSYGIDTNWYFDSGSIDHITNTLDNPTTREQYHGQDQIHATNGKGMSISHIGNTTFHTPHS